MDVETIEGGNTNLQLALPGFVLYFTVQPTCLESATLCRQVGLHGKQVDLLIKLHH